LGSQPSPHSLFLFNAGSLPASAETWTAGLVFTLAVFLVLLRTARRLRVVGCTGIARAVSYIRWQGSHHAFIIRSYRFAYDFMSLNGRKLINLPPHTVRWLKKSGIDQAKAPQAPTRFLPRIDKRR